MVRLLAPLPVVLALVAPAGAAAAGTQPCDRLVPDHPPALHEAVLGGGLTAFVEDRYGGYVAKQRHGAVQFVLRLRRGDHVLDRSERAGAIQSAVAQLDGR
jgi:hypothetical protein